MRAISSYHNQNLLTKELLIAWSPQEDWCKLNTNGAAKGSPGLAGYGGVLRDHTVDRFLDSLSRLG